jgi:hypothetical protein
MWAEPELRADGVKVASPEPVTAQGTIKVIEKEAIRGPLDEVGGNRARAAEPLGMRERRRYGEVKGPTGSVPGGGE